MKRHFMFLFLIVSFIALEIPNLHSAQKNSLNDAQSILNQANDYVGRWRFLDCFNIGPFEEIHAKILSAFSAVSTTAGALSTWPTHGFFDNPLFEVGLAAGVVMGIPVAIYTVLNTVTTKGLYAQAVNQVGYVVYNLKDDVFYNDTLDDKDISGFIFTRFGFKTGVVQAHEHYHALYVQLQRAHELLLRVKETSDGVLLHQSKALDNLISSISLKLMQKLTVLYTQQKEDYKEQVEQMQKELKAQKEVLELAADRAAAQVAGTIGYKVVKNIATVTV